MTQIPVSDDVASELSSAAANRGCTEEELASMLIQEGLRLEQHLELTPAMEERLLESIAQAERGELIDGEVVMARFEQALQRIGSR